MSQPSSKEFNIRVGMNISCTIISSEAELLDFVLDIKPSNPFDVTRAAKILRETGSVVISLYRDQLLNVEETERQLVEIFDPGPLKIVITPSHE